MASSRSSLPSSSPQPGDKAPVFALPDSTGARWKLASAKGRWLVLYFYPKALSPSCTKQACDLSEMAWGDPAPVVVGISPDAPDMHAKFIAQSKLSITLLADLPASDGTPPVCAKFGAWGEKSMYGKAYQGVLRTTLLIDPKGVVRARWDSVRVPGHAQAVREQLAALTGTPAKASVKVPVKTASKARPAAKKKASSKARRGG